MTEFIHRFIATKALEQTKVIDLTAIPASEVVFVFQSPFTDFFSVFENS